MTQSSLKKAVPAKPPDVRSQVYLVTGFPNFLCRELIERIARSKPDHALFILAQAKFAKDAGRFVARLKHRQTEVVIGDVADMHLGLAGEEYDRLCAQVTQVFHLAAISYLGIPKETAWRVNVEGTHNVVDFARECLHFERLEHLSSCYVSGDRVGVIEEDELECGQRFRNAFEETKFLAEKCVAKSAEHLPVAIYRPSSVVGSSRTGEIDRFDGPLYLALHWITSSLTGSLPLPGNGSTPMNVVPIDFVADAIWALGQNPRAIGRVFHLVDPHPASARRICDQIARRANKQLPKFNFSAKAADVLLRLPGLEKLTRPERAGIHYVNQMALYNGRATRELLEASGIRCPSLPEYLEVVSQYFRRAERSRTEPSEFPDDPFYPPGPAQ